MHWNLKLLNKNVFNFFRKNITSATCSVLIYNTLLSSLNIRIYFEIDNKPIEHEFLLNKVSVRFSLTSCPVNWYTKLCKVTFLYELERFIKSCRQNLSDLFILRRKHYLLIIHIYIPSIQAYYSDPVICTII